MEFENLQIEVPVSDESQKKKEVLDPKWEKTYHNKSKGFVVGLDLNSKDAVSRKQRRAQRFGLKSQSNELVEHCDPFEKIDLDKISFPSVTSAALAEKRLEALHLYGVCKMSTKDVFDYFKNHGPDTMEWIDDDSCNVVFETERMALTALKDMSRSYKELAKEVMDEDFDENEAKGIWRIALPYKKSEFLFLRKATADDKKMPGAAKRSMYYLIHGQGNRGKGRPGLVSSSRKRKLQQANAFATENLKSKNPDVQFVTVEEKRKEKRQSEDESMDIDEELDFIPLKMSKGSHKKGFRSGMYADDIEENTASQDIIARLGKEENLRIEVSNVRDKPLKWTSGRRNQHRRDASSSEEESDDEEFVSDTDEQKNKSDEESVKLVQKQEKNDPNDLREQIDSSDLRAKIESRSAQKQDSADLRDKLRLKKNHLGLTKEQLNLSIEVTEVSDED